MSVTNDARLLRLTLTNTAVRLPRPVNKMTNGLDMAGRLAQPGNRPSPLRQIDLRSGRGKISHPTQSGHFLFLWPRAYFQLIKMNIPIKLFIGKTTTNKRRFCVVRIFSFLFSFYTFRYILFGRITIVSCLVYFTGRDSVFDCSFSVFHIKHVAYLYINLFH